MVGQLGLLGVGKPVLQRKSQAVAVAVIGREAI